MQQEEHADGGSSAHDSTAIVKVLSKGTEVGHVTWLNPLEEGQQPELFTLLQPAPNDGTAASNKLQGRKALEALGVDKTAWRKRFHLQHSLQLPCGKVFSAGTSLKEVHAYKMTASGCGSLAAPACEPVAATEGPSTPGRSTQQDTKDAHAAALQAASAGTPVTVDSPSPGPATATKQLQKSSIRSAQEQSGSPVPLTPEYNMETPRVGSSSRRPSSDPSTQPSSMRSNTPVAAGLDAADAAMLQTCTSGAAGLGGSSAASGSKQDAAVAIAAAPSARAAQLETAGMRNPGATDEDVHVASAAGPAAQAAADIAAQWVPEAVPVYVASAYGRQVLGHAQWIGGRAELSARAPAWGRTAKFLLCDQQHKPLQDLPAVSGRILVQKALGSAGLSAPKKMVWQRSVRIAAPQYIPKLDTTFAAGTSMGYLELSIKCGTSNPSDSPEAKQIAEKNLAKLQQAVVGAGLTWQDGVWWVEVKGSPTGAWNVTYHNKTFAKKFFDSMADVVRYLQRQLASAGHRDEQPQRPAGGADSANCRQQESQLPAMGNVPTSATEQRNTAAQQQQQKADEIGQPGPSDAVMLMQPPCPKQQANQPLQADTRVEARGESSKDRQQLPDQSPVLQPCNGECSNRKKRKNGKGKVQAEAEQVVTALKPAAFQQERQSEFSAAAFNKRCKHDKQPKQAEQRQQELTHEHEQLQDDLEMEAGASANELSSSAGKSKSKKPKTKPKQPFAECPTRSNDSMQHDRATLHGVRGGMHAITQQKQQQSTDLGETVAGNGAEQGPKRRRLTQHTTAEKHVASHDETAQQQQQQQKGEEPKQQVKCNAELQQGQRQRVEHAQHASGHYLPAPEAPEQMAAMAAEVEAAAHNIAMDEMAAFVAAADDMAMVPINHTASDDSAQVAVAQAAADEVWIMDSDDDDDDVAVMNDNGHAHVLAVREWPEVMAAVSEMDVMQAAAADSGVMHMPEPAAVGVEVRVPADADDAAGAAVVRMWAEQAMLAEMLAHDAAQPYNGQYRAAFPSLVFRHPNSHRIKHASMMQARTALNNALVALGLGHLCEQASAAWDALGHKRFARAYVDLDAAWQANNVGWFRRVLRDYCGLQP